MLRPSRPHGRGGGMELGMIGLGRMGANMAERLVRDGHRVVGFDPGAQAREQAAARGIEAVATLAGAGRQPGRAARAVADGAGRRTGRPHHRRVAAAARGRRRRHRRRQLQLQGHDAPRGDAGRARHRLRRLRHQRRRVGPGRGLQPDDRRRRSGGRAAAADLQRAGARARPRLGPGRSQRRRPLHQDGPQRHRVRNDAGLRRRLRDHAAQGATSRWTWSRSRRSGATAAWCARGCST